MVYKCKMCDAPLEIIGGDTIATCAYCGITQALPRLQDEKKADLFERANHFFRNHEYDKAMAIYERILNEDTADAESYWSLVLCRYGVEYVEDPNTHKHMPTINRAQFTSVFDDEDYKAAIRYADAKQKEIYEAEARKLNEIQKGILTISEKEEPFDIFICYKETDKDGRRTPDSVLAMELYHELTDMGYRVFFSRITLEDKLGIAYEPYIFAALHSAKVMVVLGTKAEYFNAVWVKNEWSRYLALIKQGEKKVLIPAYRDMDPYDLPEEFSHLQAQDMSKLGFMQDLVRGIDKIVEAEERKGQVSVKETVVISGEKNTSIEALLKRGFLSLEEGEWSNADVFLEQTLNIDAECAKAYLGKLMAELKVRHKEDLRNCKESFEENINLKRAYRFGDETLRIELNSYITHILERNKYLRQESNYGEAIDLMKTKALDPDAFLKAATLFRSISGYKDSDILAKECEEKAKSVGQEKIYREAYDAMQQEKIFLVDRMRDLETAILKFETIPGYKDADERLLQCKKQYEEFQKEFDEKCREIEKAEKKQKRRKTFLIILLVLVVLLLVGIGKYIADTPYRELRNAIKNQTLTIEMCDYGYGEEEPGIFYKYLKEEKGEDLVLYYLGKYEEAGDGESALWLMSIVPYYEFESDRWPDYTFPDWLVTYIEENGVKTEEFSYADYYEVHGYKIDVSYYPRVEIRNGVVHCVKSSITSFRVWR